MNAPRSYIQTRLEKRDLPALLVQKFLTEYGYDHGPVIARAIVSDILTTVEACYAEHVPPRTITWLAVRRETVHGDRKGLSPSDLIPIHLTLVNQAELELLMDPALGRTRQARAAFNQARLVRWCFDAFKQGAVLTQLDLSVLSGLSTDAISRAMRRYEAESGEIVPTRGTVHDLGPSVTHKAEVVRRWLRHESPAQIARALNHSQEAVDRYLADFQKVRTLSQKFPPAEIPILAGLAPSVVRQYLELLRQYEPTLVLCEPPPAVPL